jgi:hypothetical protein
MIIDQLALRKPTIAGKATPVSHPQAAPSAATIHSNIAQNPTNCNLYLTGGEDEAGNDKGLHNYYEEEQLLSSIPGANSTTIPKFL